MTNELTYHLKGIFVLQVTPFTQKSEIDFDGLSDNIERSLAQNAHGVVVGGTYAEYPSMSQEERLELFRTAIKAVGGRVPVVCCTAASGTPEAIELTQAAAELGADAAMITAPYVHEVRTDDISRHFTAIARAVPLPIMVYHSTSIGVTIDPDLMARIAELDNVVAVKQGATDLHEQIRSLAAVGERAAMFCGSDGVALASLALGYAGCSTTLGNFMAGEYVELYREISTGDLPAARKRFFRWQPIRDAMREVGQPAGVKAAMEVLGLAGGSPRLPFARLPVAAVNRIEAALEKAGVGLETSARAQV